MNSKLLAFVLVIAGCVAAAGTGMFLAFRERAPEPAASTVAAPGDATTANEPGATPVTETEAMVTPAPDGSASTIEAPAQPPKIAPSAPEKARVRARELSREARAQARPVQEGARRPSARPVDPPQRETQSAPAAPVEAPPVTAVPQEAPLPAPEPVRPPEQVFEEVIVPAESVIGLQIDRTVSSETARVEDRVDARVTRDVRVGGRVAVPAGSKAQGTVTLVDRGGKVKERARLGVRFHTLVLADGTRVPIQSETVFREGESPSGESAAKIGGAAIGGAIIGAILGGAKGAAIGGAAGAGGGTAAVMAGGRNAAVLQSGQTVTVRLQAPVPVTVARE